MTIGYLEQFLQHFENIMNIYWTISKINELLKNHLRGPNFRYFRHSYLRFSKYFTGQSSSQPPKMWPDLRRRTSLSNLSHKTPGRRRTIRTGRNHRQFTTPLPRIQWKLTTLGKYTKVLGIKSNPAGLIQICKEKLTHWPLSLII